MSERQEIEETPVIKIDEANRILFYIRKKPNGFLSNFERSGFRFEGNWYPTNEHCYQSHKARDTLTRMWIRSAPSAWLAMKAGRALRMHETVPDWDTQKFVVMKIGLYAKFSQNEALKNALLSTGNATIHEDSPTDMIWGIKGDDRLGKLLMEVREELRHEAE